jgi:hypothetical protein
VGWIYDWSCGTGAGTTATSSGSCSFTMPAAAGTYELRPLVDNGSTLLTPSSSIAVS